MALLRTSFVALFALTLTLAGSGCAGCSERPGGRGRDTGVDAPFIMEEDVGESAPDAPGPMTLENCANSLDDTGEGYVDEGCVCPALDEWQYCWPGTPGRRGLGACRDGIQQCVSYGEFLSWGGCEGAILPSDEIPGNGVDEDCDGSDGSGTDCGEFEDCSAVGDEDCDGYPDCSDLDCAALPSCVASCQPYESVCADRIDEDCDGYLDCDDTDCDADPRCTPPPPPPPGCTREFPFIAEILCGDGRDNDCDTFVDCADSDCLRPGTCGCDMTETACRDGVDNDCDDSGDCADTDCQRCAAGSRRWCDDPMYCHWGTQDCGSDGRWGACIETTDRPGTCTGSIYSLSCCMSAGGCCENYPTDHSSVGNCASTVSCL